jgi:hypothetical protein
MAFGNPAVNAFNKSHALHQASPAQYDDQGNQIFQWAPTQPPNMLNQAGTVGTFAAQQQAPAGNLGLSVIGNPSPANMLNRSPIHPANAGLLAQLIQQQALLTQPAQQRRYMPGLLAT